MSKIFRQPVRKIRPNHRSVTGWVSIGGVSVACESTLERDFVILTNFKHPDAVIVSQPVRIHYAGEDGKRRHYTPDYSVTYSTGAAELVEVKFKADLDARWAELKPKMEAGRAYAKMHGMTFRIVTEIDLRTDSQVENANFLRTFRKVTSDPAIEQTLLAALQRSGPISIRELLNRTHPHEESARRALEILWKMLGTGKLIANFQDKMTFESKIWCRKMNT